MVRIKHEDAISLEKIVCRLYKCSRSDVFGLADADFFESHPIDAAIMVVSYIYAHNLQDNEKQYSDFLWKYINVFKGSENDDIEHEVKEYIEELSKIVKKY